MCKGNRRTNNEKMNVERMLSQGEGKKQGEKTLATMNLDLKFPYAYNTDVNRKVTSTKIANIAQVEKWIK